MNRYRRESRPLRGGGATPNTVSRNDLGLDVAARDRLCEEEERSRVYHDRGETVKALALPTVWQIMARMRALTFSRFGKSLPVSRIA
jgi:hypothetical protein